jgi:hypothetical protein
LGTITASLANATGTADSLTFNLNDTTDAHTNTATLKVSDVETINFAYSTTAAALASHTITVTDLVTPKIVISGSDANLDNVVTLTSLNAATTTIDASAFKGKLIATTTATGAVTVSATGTIAQNITTGNGNDTITLGGYLAAIVQTVAGGGGNDILNVTVDNAATDFTSVTAVETINITVGANKQAGFGDTVAKISGFNAATTVYVLGGDSLSTLTNGVATATGSTGVITAKAAAQTIDASNFNGAINLKVANAGLNAFMTIKGGALTTDKVTTIVSTTNTGAKVASMTGVETLVVESTDNEAASSALDLANVTGLTTVDAQFTTNTNADIITLSNLAAGVNVKATSTKTADNLVVTLASTSGAADSLNFELTQNAADAAVFNLDAAGIETLNITNKATNATATILLDGVAATSGSTTAVTVTGAGTGTTLTSMSSSIRSVNASTATGALTIAPADRTTSTMTITGGDGADHIAMKAVTDVLTGGAGTDTLTVSYAGILGGVQVDLSATDVITSMDGSSNTASQTGFENVNLSAFTGFGAVVTGSSAANTITGTNSADNITGGEGADTITAGDGIDSISLTESTSTIDTLYLGASVALTDNDVVTGFSTTDVIVLDKSDYTLNGTAAALGNAIAGATYYEGAVAGAVQATAYDVVVLNAVSYADVNAAEDAVANRSGSDGTKVFVAFHVTGTTTAMVYYDADLGVDDVLTNASAVMTLTGVADATALGNLLSTANFNLIA